jgi:hypothetical protein
VELVRSWTCCDELAEDLALVPSASGWLPSLMRRVLKFLFMTETISYVISDVTQVEKKESWGYLLEALNPRTLPNHR